MKEGEHIKEVSEPNCLLDSLCGSKILRLTGSECNDWLLLGRPANWCTIGSVNRAGDGLAATYIVGVVGIRTID